MEFVTARELRLDPKSVWNKLKEQSMGIVTLNGKPCFLITALKPEDLEEVLYIQRRIRAELALHQMREQASRKGLDRLTPREVETVIAKTRRARKK